MRNSCSTGIVRSAPGNTHQELLLHWNRCSSDYLFGSKVERLLFWMHLL